MNGCTCYRSNVEFQREITPWAESISTAQMENIKKNFASAKPMNEKMLAIEHTTSSGTAAESSAAGVQRADSANLQGMDSINTQRADSISMIRHQIIPYYTGYARIDNAIVGALQGKSEELKDNVYEIIRYDLLRHDVHGLEESDRLALIGLGVEKAQYLADNFLDDKSKASFMEAIRSIARIGTAGTRVGACEMEYNVKHAVGIDGYGYVHEGIGDEALFSMERESPKDYAAYKNMMESSDGNKVDASFFLLRWAMKNISLIAANRPDYNKSRNKKYEQLQKVELDSTFAGADTSNKKNFLTSITEKLQANQNLQTSFFLQQISKMTNVSGEYLLGRYLSLAARA